MNKAKKMELINGLNGEKINTIAVDFDGTLCERKKFPQIGEPKLELIQWLKAQRSNGVKLILWSCREGEDLCAAVQWCEGYGLTFDAVNENLPSCGLRTRKVIADLYIDDRACVPIYEEKKLH